MQKRSSKRPRDSSQLAKSIVDQVIGVCALPAEADIKTTAVVLGRFGGLKGGVARAKALTKNQRSAIATIAAKARWKKAEG
jgi:hypothetical protein